MNTIDIFIELGRRLESFGGNESSQRVIARAMAENGWFTREDIIRSVEAIRDRMLQAELLAAWCAKYPTVDKPQDVAIIMAGNIPLVGFFDLLCTVISGHRCHIKTSSKDRTMMDYIVSLLRDIEPSISIYDYSSTADYDMLIATGGDEAIRYFDEHYPTTRRLLRGSRHSVAVLDGRESDEELRGLEEDITAYSGLGCRSVSLIFTPEGHHPRLHTSAPRCTKLEHNLRSELALRKMQRADYEPCGGFILCPSDDFPTTLSVISIAEYRELSDVERWLKLNGHRIQCVVSHIKSLGTALPFGSVIPFGKAQYPTLNDYADGIDTMQWLRGME